MPVYKITQQQGNRVITSTLEAKSVASVQAFLQAASTAKIKYIYLLLYYFNIIKFLQIFLHFLKTLFVFICKYICFPSNFHKILESKR